MKRVVIVGGGPAGLIAAYTLAKHGALVDLYEAMPSVGRKLLVAGVGGLNLTHSERLADFVARFGSAAPAMYPILTQFPPDELRRIAREFGVETKIGSSGRVFPVDFKAAPLLRALVRELRRLGVRIHTRHRLVSFAPPHRLSFSHGEERVEVAADATILALGGATWRRLGSDGMWMPMLASLGVEVRPFAPSNCGFEIAWSMHFRERFAGTPVKNAVFRCGAQSVAGEAVVTKHGIEGGAIYALSARLRESLAATGSARLEIDLKPAWSAAEIERRLRAESGSRSLAERVRRAVRGEKLVYPLLREVAPITELADPGRVAAGLKAIPLTVRGIRPLDEAISTAGGVTFAAVTPTLELRALEGVFVAGEMLDYDPPTGGYLLQAAFATGVRAALGALRRLGLGCDKVEST